MSTYFAGITVPGLMARLAGWEPSIFTRQRAGQAGAKVKKFEKPRGELDMVDRAVNCRRVCQLDELSEFHTSLGAQLRGFWEFVKPVYSWTESDVILAQAATLIEIAERTGMTGRARSSFYNEVVGAGYNGTDPRSAALKEELLRVVAKYDPKT